MSIEVTLPQAYEQFSQQAALFVDIRDPQSFSTGHIPGAQPLNNENFAQFIDNTDKERKVIVVCYHGVSSRQATEILLQQGFSDVRSMQGGFTAWQTHYPSDIEQS